QRPAPHLWVYWVVVSWLEARRVRPGGAAAAGTYHPGPRDERREPLSRTSTRHDRPGQTLTLNASAACEREARNEEHRPQLGTGRLRERSEATVSSHLSGATAHDA